MNKEVARILRVKKLVVKFRNLSSKGEFGHIYDKIIVLDPKRQLPLAKVFLHECLHYLYPIKPETEILKMENSVWKRLSRKDIERLYKKMFRVAHK